MEDPYCDKFLNRSSLTHYIIYERSLRVRSCYLKSTSLISISQNCFMLLTTTCKVDKLLTNSPEIFHSWKLWWKSVYLTFLLFLPCRYLRGSQLNLWSFYRICITCIIIYVIKFCLGNKQMLILLSSFASPFSTK